mgnify:CR=1 FL=1|jgi:hypothetical protein|tara:strand:- start:73 stop:402 length:330 start_codon:yes stop_codon:yes gene_type:complete
MSRCAYTDITPWTWVKSYAGTYRMTTDLGTYTAYVTDSFSGNHKWAVRVQDKTSNDVYSSTYGPHAPLGYPTLKNAKVIGYTALLNLAEDINGKTDGLRFLPREAKRNG